MLTVKEFKALPKKEKAVLVAKDVIKQATKNKKMVFDTGNYCKMQVEDFLYDVDARDNIKKMTQCTVCGLGVAMFSIVMLEDTLTFWELKSFDQDEKALKMLKGVFSRRQMLLIETAFEGYDGCSRRLGNEVKEEKGKDIVLSAETVMACEGYRDKYSDDRERVIAIYKNIIENGGEFKP